MKYRDKFWGRVDKNGPLHPTLGRCWSWTGARLKSGYGKFGGGLGHRYSWLLHRGPIPKGKSVLHKCDNPQCTNPTHLFLGTQQDNLADMRAKGRQVRGERQGAAKLTAEDVAAIRARYRRYSHQHGSGVLAKEYGVGHVQIHRIVKGVAWKHVV